MNPYKLKKPKYPTFEKYEKLDLKETNNYEIDHSMLEELFDNNHFNVNFDSSYGVKSTMHDMKVVIGLKHNGEIEIIKNESFDGGFKFVNTNVIMRMFIKMFRIGIMRFNINKLKLFTEQIEKDLENAIMSIVEKYDLSKSGRNYNGKDCHGRTRVENK